MSDLVEELRDLGWPSVGDDVEEGVPLETVLERLDEIGEGDSDAAEAVAREIAHRSELDAS